MGVNAYNLYGAKDWEGIGLRLSDPHEWGDERALVYVVVESKSRDTGLVFDMSEDQAGEVIAVLVGKLEQKNRADILSALLSTVGKALGVVAGRQNGADAGDVLPEESRGAGEVSVGSDAG